MITKEFINFFIALSQNNNREWFKDHKNEYEKFVKEPFKDLVSEIAIELNKRDESIVTNPSKNIFRINRDIRFSKDKTPYNLHVRAAFSPNGRKSDLPGYYLGLDAEKIHIGGGLYMADSKTLYSIRKTIQTNLDDFTEILNSKSFKSSFNGLKGERMKRIPKEFKETYDKTPYVANKQFYVMIEKDITEFLDKENLSERILSYYQKLGPLMEFLKKAIIS